MNILKKIRFRLDGTRRIVVHPLNHGMPRVKLVSQKALDHPDQLIIARRLLEAYSQARDDECKAKIKTPKNDLWTNLVKKEFNDLLRILQEKDVNLLSEYLLHFGEKYTWFGGLTLSVDGFTIRRDASSVAISYLDKLICLAEAIGVLSVENPEQLSEWGLNLYSDVNEIIDKIEKKVGIAIAPPLGVVPVTGIDTRCGPLHYRHFNSIYAALRLRDLLGNKGAICEYGGGLGLVAYYASQLGMQDYVIFDLPIACLFAGYFLMRTLGKDKVCLYKEECKYASVNVQPYWRCMDFSEGAFSIALNQDSFPEIDPQLVDQYLTQIARTTRKYFFSINQEARAPMGTRNQNSVPEMMQRFDVFHRVYRMKYWMREGYVEELYEICR